jgi:hypothetical protein
MKYTKQDLIGFIRQGIAMNAGIYTREGFEMSLDIIEVLESLPEDEKEKEMTGDN